MNMKNLAGICILVPILLAGCGNQSDTQTTAAGTSQPVQQTENSAGNGQANGQGNRPAMDPAKMQLFSTFQMLTMMDKSDGLTITKEQAEAMLPVAQDIVAKNELSEDNKTKLLAKLTDAQKTFLTDAESRMANRGNGGFGGPNGQGQGQRQGQGNRNGGTSDAQAPNATAAPGANATDGAGNGQQAGGQRPNRDANGGGQNGGSGFGGGNRPAGGQMGDLGKQFVELLQTKVK